MPNPALTLCNLSPLRYDRFIEPFLSYMNETDPESFPPTYIPFISSFLQSKINRNEDLSPYFFPLSSMLMRCTFNGQNCTVHDFVAFTSSTYGLCYIFNAKMKDVENGGMRHNHENGGAGRLLLQLYAHSHLYVPYYTEGTGMIVTVHDNADLPRVQVSGIELAPGFRHRLTYRKRVTLFPPPPYSTCSDEIPSAVQAMFQHYPGADFAYSEDLCMMTCIQAHNYDQCGCIDPNRWDAQRIVLPGADTVILAPLCNYSDPCYVEAASLLLGDMDVMMKYCSMCVSHCGFTNFMIRSSLSKTPPTWLINDIKQFVEKNASITLPSDWSTNWRQHVREDYLSVELIRETTWVEHFEQEPSIGLLDVLGNIGGHSGLWIGISFLSLMEFAEMLYRVARHQLHLIRNNARR